MKCTASSTNWLTGYVSVDVLIKINCINFIEKDAMLRKHLWFLKAAIHFLLLLKTAEKIYPVCAVSSSLNVPFHKVHFVLLPCMTFVYGKHGLLRSHNLIYLSEHKWYLINIWTEGMWIVDSLIFSPWLFLDVADWRHPQDFFYFFFSPLQVLPQHGVFITALIALPAFLCCQYCDLRLKSSINIKKKF